MTSTGPLTICPVVGISLAWVWSTLSHNWPYPLATLPFPRLRSGSRLRLRAWVLYTQLRVATPTRKCRYRAPPSTRPRMVFRLFRMTFRSRTQPCWSLLKSCSWQTHFSTSFLVEKVASLIGRKFGPRMQYVDSSLLIASLTLRTAVQPEWRKLRQILFTILAKKSGQKQERIGTT